MSGGGGGGTRERSSSTTTTKRGGAHASRRAQAHPQSGVLLGTPYDDSITLSTQGGEEKAIKASAIYEDTRRAYPKEEKLVLRAALEAVRCMKRVLASSPHCGCTSCLVPCPGGKRLMVRLCKPAE